jgi:hypothetical protein
MQVLTYNELLKMFDKGYFREVYNEVRRYGFILSDYTITETSGYYVGDSRYLSIKYLSKVWSFMIYKGEVKEMSWE